MYVPLNWVIFGSVNDLLPVRQQTMIACTNADLLSISPKESSAKFESKHEKSIQKYAFENIVCKWWQYVS